MRTKLLQLSYRLQVLLVEQRFSGQGNIHLRLSYTKGRVTDKVQSHFDRQMWNLHVIGRGGHIQPYMKKQDGDYYLIICI